MYLWSYVNSWSYNWIYSWPIYCFLICLMQCLCIGNYNSDGDSSDEGDGEQVISWPHPETLLCCQKHKKSKFKHCCGTAPFVFFYEWKRRQHFPKICGPTCRTNVMFNCNLMFLGCSFVFFCPEELNIQYNHKSLNLRLAINSRYCHGQTTGALGTNYNYSSHISSLIWMLVNHRSKTTSLMFDLSS